MAFGLEYSMEWLRNKYSWQPNQCGVQFDALPPAEAGSFYVAIDDAGVESGPDNTASLREILNITIGIWRKPEHLSQKDRKGVLPLPVDKYLLGAYTLHDLQRAVLICNPEQKLYGFHQNWAFMNGLNTRYGLPSLVDGGTFSTPLFYRGRGRMEFIGIEGGLGQDAQPWFGYRMRFRGLLREQPTNNSNYALG